MRTTVTLDPDVHAALDEAAQRSGRSFKATLNDALRAGLARKATMHRRPEPPKWPVFDMGAPLIGAGRGGNLVTDAQLAALAIENEAELITFDRDFGQFAGLRSVLLTQE